MEPEGEDKSVTALKLDGAFGDRPVTWFEIEDKLPCCTVDAAEAYFRGDPVDPGAKTQIEAALAWRPSLRWCFDFPDLEGKVRVELKPEVTPDANGRVVRIDCREGNGRSPRAVVFERVSDEVFSVQILGCDSGADVGLVVDRSLLPILPEERPGEWARVHQDDVRSLADGSGTISLIVPVVQHTGGERPSRRGRLRGRVTVLRRNLAGGVLACGLAGGLVGLLLGRMPSSPSGDFDAVETGHRSALVERETVSRINALLKDASSEYQGAESGSWGTVAVAVDGGGSMSMLAYGQRAGEIENSFSFYKLDSSGSPSLDVSRIPFDIPPSLGRWYQEEPEPFIAGIEVLDVLPDSENPGDELIVIRRHRMVGIAVLQVCSLDGRVLREVWNRGYIYSCSEGPRPGTIAITGASNRLPQSAVELRLWEQILLQGMHAHFHPNFAAVLDVAALPDHSVLFPSTGGSGMPESPTLAYLAQPPVHAHRDLQLFGAEVSPLGPELLTLKFRRIGLHAGEGGSEVLCDVNVRGDVVGGWRSKAGATLADLADVRGMIALDTASRADALALVSDELSATPGMVAAAFGAADVGAARVAELRGSSAVWVMDEAYEDLSRPTVDQRLASAYVGELAGFAEASGSWNVSHRQRLLTAGALALYRSGQADQALDVINALPVGGSDQEAERFEAMAVRALVLAGLGRSDEAFEQLAIMNEELLKLTTRRQWNVWTDSRTVRIWEEAIALIE